MSREGSLFERLRLADVSDDLQVRRDPTLVARSICRNLERVFNTWRGSVPIESEYGLPDDLFAGGTRGVIAARVAGLIKDNLARYEPRLREVIVSPGTDDPMDAYAWEFLIKARLVTADGRPRAIFTVRRRRDLFVVSF